MNSFNVYGQTEERIGGNTPVWLGTVKPVPVGAIVNGSMPAGTVGVYSPKDGSFSPILSLSIPGVLGSANAYVYNDVVMESGVQDGTCAIVMHHPEGLLIERVYPDITEEQIVQLQSQIPGVLLVREPNQSAE